MLVFYTPFGIRDLIETKNTMGTMGRVFEQCCAHQSNLGILQTNSYKYVQMQQNSHTQFSHAKSHTHFQT